MDNWEEIEPVLAQLNAARKQFIVDGPHVHANIEPLEAVQAIVVAINLLEAICVLRKQDEKRWELVEKVEVSAARLGDQQSGCATNQCEDCKEQMRLWADRLREAREGRDA